MFDGEVSGAMREGAARISDFVKLRVRVRVKVKVKSLKSKLDPEVRSVIAWPTTHPPPYNFFLS